MERRLLYYSGDSGTPIKESTDLVLTRPGHYDNGD